jgi:hypothetical protein
MLSYFKRKLCVCSQEMVMFLKIHSNFTDLSPVNEHRIVTILPITCSYVVGTIHNLLLLIGPEELIKFPCTSSNVIIGRDELMISLYGIPLNKSSLYRAYDKM